MIITPNGERGLYEGRNSWGISITLSAPTLCLTQVVDTWVLALYLFTLLRICVLCVFCECGIAQPEWLEVLQKQFLHLLFFG